MDIQPLLGETSLNQTKRSRKSNIYLAVAVVLFLISAVVLIILLTLVFDIHRSENTEFPPEFLVTEEDIPKSVVFVGHTRCDTDSIAGAISAAYLFDGVPAKCVDNLNPETAYVLKHWGIEEPLSSTSSEFKDRKWGLVDHSELAQIPSGVDKEEIVIIIDHHQMSSGSISFSAPMYIDARPWGSASTVMTWKYFESRRHIPDEIAKLLMSAIISDTINLRSSTTTKFDTRAMLYFREQLGMSSEEVDQYALAMFKAKSDVSGISDYNVTLLDFKQYNMESPAGNVLVGWGAAETALTDEYLQRNTSFLEAMLQIKADQQLDLMFFAPVNILSDSSTLYLCAETERIVAQNTYGRQIIWSSGTYAIMDTTGLMSRKHDFIPPLVDYLKNHNLTA